MSYCLVNYKYYSFPVRTDKKDHDKIFVEEEQGRVKTVKGIKYYMKKVWEQEIPPDLQQDTDIVSQLLYEIYDYNCAVVCFMTLAFYGLTPNKRKPISRLIFIEDYF